MGCIQYRCLSRCPLSCSAEGMAGGEGPSRSNLKTRVEKRRDRTDSPGPSFHRKARRAAGDFPAKEPVALGSETGAIGKSAAAPCQGPTNQRITLRGGSSGESTFSPSIQDAVAGPSYSRAEGTAPLLSSVL